MGAGATNFHGELQSLALTCHAERLSPHCLICINSKLVENKCALLLVAYGWPPGILKRATQQNIADLAAYYASLPKARTAPTTYDESPPARCSPRWVCRELHWRRRASLFVVDVLAQVPRLAIQWIASLKFAESFDSCEGFAGAAKERRRRFLWPNDTCRQNILNKLYG